MIDAGLVFLGRAMREVDTSHIEPGIKEFFENARPIAGRSEGGDNARATLHENSLLQFGRRRKALTTGLIYENGIDPARRRGGGAA